MIETLSLLISILFHYSFRAATGLNGAEFEGSNLTTELLLETKSQLASGAAGAQRRSQRSRATYGAGAVAGPGRQTDFPLRVLVASDMVGAIIGRQVNFTSIFST